MPKSHLGNKNWTIKCEQLREEKHWMETKEKRQILNSRIFIIFPLYMFFSQTFSTLIKTIRTQSLH